MECQRKRTDVYASIPVEMFNPYAMPRAAYAPWGGLVDGRYPSFASSTSSLRPTREEKRLPETPARRCTFVDNLPSSLHTEILYSRRSPRRPSLFAATRSTSFSSCRPCRPPRRWERDAPRQRQTHGRSLITGRGRGYTASCPSQVSIEVQPRRVCLVTDAYRYLTGGMHLLPISVRRRPLVSHYRQWHRDFPGGRAGRPGNINFPPCVHTCRP